MKQKIRTSLNSPHYWLPVLEKMINGDCLRGETVYFELAQKEGISEYRRRDLGFVDATERGLDGDTAKEDVRIW